MGVSNTKKKSLSIAEKHAEDNKEAKPFSPIKAPGKRKDDESALTFDVENRKIEKLNLITFRCFAGKKKIARTQAINDFLDKYDRDGYLIAE